MSEIEIIIEKLTKFRDDRDWDKFHNIKDLSIALSIEANELLEVFLWKEPLDVDINKVKEELADVFSFAFLILNKLNLNLEQIITEKININEKKYPIEKSKGLSTKYDEL